MLKMHAGRSERGFSFKRFGLWVGWLLILQVLIPDLPAPKPKEPPEPKELTKEPPEPKELTLDALRQRGELVVLTRQSPTTYYLGYQNEPEGFEYDLVLDFARFLGVSRVRFLLYDNTPAIIDGLRAGAGDLAAAGLTPAGAWRQEFPSGPSYGTVQQQVVCRRDGPRPRTLKQLAGLRVSVVDNSTHEEILERLKRESIPTLVWESAAEADTEELLERVWRRQLDCTIAYSNSVAVNRRYYPELAVAFSLYEKMPLAWSVAPSARALLPALEDWFRQPTTQAGLEQLRERYYGHLEPFDYVDIRVFMRRMEQRLPRFRTLLKRAAGRYDLPWTLLAAVAYQESHWHPQARSFTGVQGLMMITQETAADLAIDNRLHTVQSIEGGARYLRQLLERVPETVRGEDRLWLALAAYNVGFGHLLDARELARRQGKDPDRWVDLKEIFPLLSRPRFYRTLRYGYARGTEPVRFVQRVRDWQDILEQRLVVQKNRPRQPRLAECGKPAPRPAAATC